MSDRTNDRCVEQTLCFETLRDGDEIGKSADDRFSRC
jgi:hypothetical protein